MSRRALSLSAYLAYARSASAPGDAPKWPDRPDGPLIWGFAEDAERGRALASLCSRMQAQRPEVTIWLSGRVDERPGIDHLPMPRELSADDLREAKSLRPDITLWTGQSLRPGLLASLSDAGSHMIALDLQDAPFPAEAPRWLPDPAPAVLALFHSLYTTGPEASRRLRRLGIDASRVHDANPFLDTDAPLDCSETLHEEMAGLLAGRPVWLAARLRAEEIRDVLGAHRQAIRLAHRLLLVVVPADEAASETITRYVEGAQMRLCHWDRGEMPDENTQVLLTSGPEDLGLWYRIAPLAFLGGSLAPGTGGEDPFEAAALGTAILYGPNVGNHLDAYSRLVGAGAARIVRDGDSLGSAVSHLVAPDQAAAMAHAGWDVISSGARLVDLVLEEICDILDSRSAA